MTKRFGRTPREHFMRTVKDELFKFECKERVLQQAEGDERASRSRLPVACENLKTSQNPERK